LIKEKQTPAGNFVKIAPISDYPEDNLRLNGGLFSPNDLNSCFIKAPHRKQTDFSGSYSKSVLFFRIESWQFYRGDVYGKHI